MYRNEEKEERCPMCENHCAADEVRCGRGRRYFAEDGNGERPDFEREEHRGHHQRFGEDRPEGERRPHRRHGEEEERGGCPHEREEREFGRPHRGMPEEREERRPRHDMREGRPDFPHEREDGEHERRPHPPIFRDPESLEGMFMANARGLRHSARKQFGSTQDRIIRILDENGGTMGQKALQELLRVQPGSISEILAKMEEKALITRTKSEDDRRASLITLTAPASPDTGSDWFEVLSEEEQDTLKELLKKVLEAHKPE